MPELLFSLVSHVWSDFDKWEIQSLSKLMALISSLSPNFIFTIPGVKRMSFDVHRDSTAWHVTGWGPASVPVCGPMELLLHCKPLHLDGCTKLSTDLISADKMKKMRKELFQLSL